MRRIFTNGNFYTFNKIQHHVEAVVIENGRFIDMGTTEDMLLQWVTPNSEVINLEGKTVSPGLTDSHLHLSLVAENFINLDLTGITTKQVLLEKIKEKASNIQPGEWILGSGWDENLFTDGTIPTIQELDYVTPYNPLLLTRVCMHAAITNSKAFEISQYHPEINVPPGGTIVLDPQTKQPTGLLLETAKTIIERHIPAVSYEVWKNAIRKTIDFCLKLGLTSAHTNDPLYLGGLKQTYQIYDELLNNDQMGLRINLLINHEFLSDLKEAGMYSGYGNETLQIGAVKLFADGAFGRRTALLSKPYSDDPGNLGDAMYSYEELYEIVRKSRELSMPIAVHTIGDQALENVLNILDQFPTSQYRDRIIHAQVLREDLIKRLVHPSRIVDIQPRFLASDFPWVEERLGKDRIPFAYAWKTLLDAGIICAGGSDAPVEPINPLLGIHAAVTRKVPGQPQVYNAIEKLSMVEAFKLFTEFSAYTTNEEVQKGTISRGKYADMTVYSKNPFTLDDEDALLELDIDMTIIGGEIRYQKH